MAVKCRPELGTFFEKIGLLLLMNTVFDDFQEENIFKKHLIVISFLEVLLSEK